MKNRPSRTISPGKIWGRTAPRCLRASVSNGCLLKAHRAPPFEGDVAVQDPRPHQLTKKHSSWKSTLPDRYYHLRLQLEVHVRPAARAAERFWMGRSASKALKSKPHFRRPPMIRSPFPCRTCGCRRRSNIKSRPSSSRGYRDNGRGGTLTILTKGWIDSPGREPN